MQSRIYARLIFAIFAVAVSALAPLDAQDRTPPKSRLVWAAKPVSPPPFQPPNRLIGRLSEILAAHKGQTNWRQPVVNTRDFEGDWISMVHYYQPDAAGGDNQ